MLDLTTRRALLRSIRRIWFGFWQIRGRVQPVESRLPCPRLGRGARRHKKEALIRKPHQEPEFASPAPIGDGLAERSAHRAGLRHQVSSHSASGLHKLAFQQLIETSGEYQKTPEL